MSAGAAVGAAAVAVGSGSMGTPPSVSDDADPSLPRQLFEVLRDRLDSHPASADMGMCFTCVSVSGVMWGKGFNTCCVSRIARRNC